MLNFDRCNKRGWFATRFASIHNGNVCNRIEACFDTGCVNTYIGLYALSVLTNLSVDVISNFIKEHSDKESITYGISANNQTNKSYPVVIEEVNIGGLNVKNFRCSVNLDESIAKTSGFTKLEDEYIQIEPYILIGLDFITAFQEIEFNNKTISCDKFNSVIYASNNTYKKNELVSFKSLYTC